MAKSYQNPILVLGFFLSLVLFAWLAVYAYNYLYLPNQEAEEARAEVARLHAAADALAANDTSIRVAYQPMPWPELIASKQRLELQAHIQPYDSERTDFLCERMPQVKDVINVVLSLDHHGLARGGVSCRVHVSVGRCHRGYCPPYK